MSIDLYNIGSFFHEPVSVVPSPGCHPTKKPSQAPDDFGGAIYTALDCNESAMEKSRSLLLGKHVFFLPGGFKHFLFSPLFGEDFPFDLYFSDGLKPPTSFG